jgi:hypothetical protein
MTCLLEKKVRKTTFLVGGSLPDKQKVLLRHFSVTALFYILSDLDPFVN